MLNPELCVDKCFKVPVSDNLEEQEAMVPLCHFERPGEDAIRVLHIRKSSIASSGGCRSAALWKTILSTIGPLESVITFSPGAGQFALATLEERIPILMVVRSEAHRKLIRDIIKKAVAARVQNKADTRFYRASIDNVEQASSTSPSNTPASESRGAPD